MGARHPCIGVARIHSLLSACAASALAAGAAVHLTGTGSATESRGGAATDTLAMSSNQSQRRVFGMCAIGNCLPMLVAGASATNLACNLMPIVIDIAQIQPGSLIRQD